MRTYAKTEKSEDNIETVAGLKEALTDWIQSLSQPFNDGNIQVEELEYLSRSGFFAHSHNRGGVDLINITSRSFLIGSGEHFGLIIEDQITESENEDYKRIKEENPKASDEEISDMVYESGQDDYESVAFRVRAMYEGDGVVCIHAGYDNDAPYFRWSGKTHFEKEIKFKTISGLKRQLKALTKKVESL